jgi:2-aminoethylphosphonate-pyruvate transaminase
VAARDYAPWDNEFRGLVARLRTRVRDVAGGREGEHTALILQGCGHFALEAACRTFVPEGSRMLLPKTGQYADRIERLATETGRIVVPLAVEEDRPADPHALRAALAADPTISHVALVYSETSTGIIHDVPRLAAVAGEAGRRVIVDAVSAFGALPFDIGPMKMVDCVCFTTNKCFEGLPGAALIVARADRLEACVGQARSWSFDLADMHRHYQKAPGAFRFTPAAGVVAGFDVALDLFDAEGGRAVRLARYTANMQSLYEGVQRLGLRPCLPREVQGPIVVNVHAPPDPAWDLQGFVDGLKSRGMLISNFYNTPAPSFRVGCIGAITPEDMRRAVQAMDATLAEMGIQARQAA